MSATAAISVRQQPQVAPSGPSGQHPVGRGTDASPSEPASDEGGVRVPAMRPSKRRIQEIECSIGGEDEWRPGAGMSHSPSDQPEEKMRKNKLQRTSLLFMELQQQVKDALRLRHDRDAREIKLSAEIAARHPIVLADGEPAHARDEVECDVQLVSASFEEKMKADALEARSRMERAQSLPAPLTHAVLNEAYKQMPGGAEASIEKCIKCWRENKMGPTDLLATVKAFSRSSAALQKLFAEATVEVGQDLGQVATPEQMRELKGLAK